MEICATQTCIFTLTSHSTSLTLSEGGQIHSMVTHKSIFEVTLDIARGENEQSSLNLML